MHLLKLDRYTVQRKDEPYKVIIAKPQDIFLTKVENNSAPKFGKLLKKWI